jgi:hypothetical protein
MSEETVYQTEEQVLKPASLFSHTTIQNIVSASAGAMITSLTMTPLDVIRTRMQIQQKGIGNFYYNGMYDATIKIIKNEGGVSALWRGLTPSLIMQIPSAGMYVYFSYAYF